MKMRIKLLSMTAALLVILGLLGGAASAATIPGVPITGTFTDSHGGTGHFVGTFNIQNFSVVSGKLKAVGTLVGTLTDSTNAVVGTVASGNVRMPLSLASGATCQILHLVLGPLSLNLLGLQVNLNKVILDITAQSGSGNLLGNLLCDIANLLNGGTPSLDSIVNLLNKLIGLLG